MNIRLFIAAALAAVLPALHAFADRVDFFDPNDNMVYIMSHRATTSDTSLPDNSIQGLNAVIEAGADMIEVDVWRTKDGKFIVWHNDRINGKIINDYNYSEFSEVRLSNGEPIPTFLSEMVQIVRNPDMTDCSAMTHYCAIALTCCKYFKRRPKYYYIKSPLKLKISH